MRDAGSRKPGKGLLLALSLGLWFSASTFALTPEDVDRLVVPGPAASAEQLLRRVSIDLTGTLPRPRAVREVREDPAALARWIEACRTSPARRAWTASRLAGLWLGRRSRLSHPGFERWIEQELARDRRVFPLIGKIVTATGIHPDQPETAWLVRFQGDPAALVTQLSRAALGESLGCAQCHDHPFAKWKRTDFLGVAAAFAQVGYAEVASMGDADRFRVWDRGWGDAWLDGSPPRAVPMSFPTTGGAEAATRRATLAAWIADARNPMPARALANRVWGWLMGRPLVAPVADLTAGKELLSGVLEPLAQELARTGGDVDALVDCLIATRAYRAARTDAGPFSPRLLTLEELSAALHDLADRPGAPLEKGEADERREALGELLERAGVEDLDEADSTPTLGRALFLIGLGPLADPGGRAGTLAERLEYPETAAGVADFVFAATLGRAPRPAERAWLEKLVAAGDRQQALGDALWAIINLPEFGVNH